MIKKLHRFGAGWASPAAAARPFTTVRALAAALAVIAGPLLLAPAPAEAGLVCFRGGFNPNFVKVLQNRLAAQGHSPGPIDGVWGDQTRRAYQDFARANDLPNSYVLTLRGLRTLLGAEFEPGDYGLIKSGMPNWERECE